MKVTIVEYIIKKLKSLNIDTVFGLPGDYNFNILDAIIKSDDLNWVNCTNELNAGYAADGYSRIKGYGALVTTYGVGELSAINAVCGSSAENLPIVHIVGVPHSLFIKNKVLVHHNFSTPDYYIFERIFKNISARSEFLTLENAKEQIDNAFNVLINTKKPIYIAIPVDYCCECIDDEGFDNFNILKSDANNLNLAFEKINSLISKSSKPFVLLDYLIKRFNLKKSVTNFLTKTNIQFATMLMGKGCVSEDLPNFTGTNSGSCSNYNLQTGIKNSDLIISFGFLNADLNTTGFSALFDREIDIQIEKNFVKIKGKIFENVLIQELTELLSEKIYKKFEFETIENCGFELKKEGNIKVRDILEKIETIFDENDIFLMETGILSLNGASLNLKANMEYLAQTLWGSIGWATPASFGAAMADKNRNVILFTGEGSHQLTIQEVSNFFRQNLNPVIFVLNNEGYTIERLLSKDKTDEFNDVIKWDYFKIIEGFSDGRDFYKGVVKTYEDFDRVLEEIKELKGKKLCYIEIFADKTDFGECSKKLVSNMENFKAKNS